MVGYFSSAEKISKAAFGLLNPIREELPRLSHLVARGGHSAASSLARLSAIAMIGGGTILGITLYLLAPLACRFLLGSAFAPAVDVLQILALLPPLLSVTYAIGFQWLLPFGKDSAINRIHPVGRSPEYPAFLRLGASLRSHRHGVGRSRGRDVRVLQHGDRCSPPDRRLERRTDASQYRPNGELRMNDRKQLWWLNPAWIGGGMGVTVSLASYLVPDTMYRTYWRMPKFFDGDQLLLCLACVAAFVLGSLAGIGRKRTADAGPSWEERIPWDIALRTSVSASTAVWWVTQSGWVRPSFAAPISRFSSAS